MCGICGIINFGGLTPEDLELFTKVFERSEDRGTDACGVGDQSGRSLKAVMPSSRMTKRPAYSEWFIPKALGQQWVVGHTRHATRGDPKDVINDHPLKVRPKVQVVHNGVVSRLDKSPLEEDVTKTDSYIIAHAVNHEWVEGDLFTSVKKAYKLFRGSAAICVFSPSEIVIARNINPIRFAVTPNQSIIFASESDFFPEVRPYEIMKDEWIIGWDVNGLSRNDKLEVVGYSRDTAWQYNWRTMGQSVLYDNSYQDDEVKEKKPTKKKEEEYLPSHVWIRDPRTGKHHAVPREEVYGKPKNDRGWFGERKRHSDAYYKGKQSDFKRNFRDIEY